MKSSLFLLAAALILASFEPVNAEPIRCNYNAWPAFSAVPCRNGLKAVNYADCTKKVIAMGWDRNVIWWYCSNLGLKD